MGQAGGEGREREGRGMRGEGGEWGGGGWGWELSIARVIMHNLIIRLLGAVAVMLPRSLMTEVAITSVIQISLFIFNSGFLLD